MDLFGAYDLKDYTTFWNRAREMSAETGERLAITLNKTAKEAGFKNYHGMYSYWVDQVKGFADARRGQEQPEEQEGDEA